MHDLLTVLGINPRQTTYALGDRSVEAELAPLALLDLLDGDDRPGRVVAICTEAALADSFETLSSALGDAAESIIVPDGRTDAEISDFLERVVGDIDDLEPDAITIDVTHGPRHFAFLMTVSLQYLRALRPHIAIRGAWYGLLSRDQPSPFLDVSRLLELPRWIHAIDVFRDTGSARPIARLLDRAPVDQLRRLRRLTDAMLSGLPIEAGFEAAEFLTRERRPLRRRLNRSLPLGGHIVDQLADEIRPFALPQRKGQSPYDKKDEVALTPGELDRQAQLVDRLLDSGNVGTATRVLSEWTVSWALLQTGSTADWLDYQSTRRSAAGRLASLCAFADDPDLRQRLDDHQATLAAFWSDLSQVRNTYAHAAIRRQETLSAETEKLVERVRDYWQSTLRHQPTIALDLAAEGTLLVSAIGHTPGVLYSALLRTREHLGSWPSRCLVVCSAETKEGIDRAAGRAGYDGEVDARELADPFAGLNELEPLSKGCRRQLLEASRVIVNVTGGTSLMGLAVQELANVARKNHTRPVELFGLIDKRKPEEQRAEPFVLGDVYWFDTATTEDADDG